MYGGTETRLDFAAQPQGRPSVPATRRARTYLFYPDLAGFFLIVDVAFVAANLAKVADGGYVPLLLAAAIYAIMWIWHRGSEAVSRQLDQNVIPIADFDAEVVARKIPRVPGAAVFLTRASRDVPPVMLWHLQHNRTLHEQLMVLTVRTASVPWTAPSKRLSVQPVARNFWRAEAIFGGTAISTHCGLIAF